MGFVDPWDRVKESKQFQLYGRLHSDICYVLRFLPPGVRIQMKLMKIKSGFFLMKKYAESKNVFKFLDAQLLVNRVRHNHTILVAHETALSH